MDDVCGELSKILLNLPDYASWTRRSLERIYFRFRLITEELIEFEPYCHYQWLRQRGITLDLRMRDMFAEQNMEKQCAAFNLIIFEIECSIKMLTGALDCGSKEQWTHMLSGASINRTAQMAMMH